MELTSDNSFEKLLCLLQLICLNLEFPVAFSTFKRPKLQIMKDIFGPIPEKLDSTISPKTFSKK